MPDTLADLFALLAEEKKRKEELRLEAEARLEEESKLDMGDFFKELSNAKPEPVVEESEPEIVIDLSSAFESVLGEITKVKKLNTELKNASFEEFLNLTKDVAEVVKPEPVQEIVEVIQPVVEEAPVDVLADYKTVEEPKPEPVVESIKEVISKQEFDSLVAKIKKLEKAFEDFKKFQTATTKKLVVSSGGGGGSVNISDMDDVSMVGATTGKVLSYNASTRKFVLADPSGGGSISNKSEISSEPIQAGDVVFIDVNGLLSIASSDNPDCIGNIVGFAQETVSAGTACQYSDAIDLIENGKYYLGLNGSISLSPPTTGFIQSLGTNGINGFVPLRGMPIILTW